MYRDRGALLGPGGASVPLLVATPADLPGAALRFGASISALSKADKAFFFLLPNAYLCFMDNRFEVNIHEGSSTRLRLFWEERKNGTNLPG
jgi:hypothetical protein